MTQEIKVLNKTGRPINVHLDCEGQPDFKNKEMKVKVFVIAVEDVLTDNTRLSPGDELTADITETIPLKIEQTKAENKTKVRWF
jgi:hypothetical protein